MFNFGRLGGMKKKMVFGPIYKLVNWAKFIDLYLELDDDISTDI